MQRWTHSWWWRHQMEPISALLAICAGNSPVTSEFPAQSPVTRNFDVFYVRLNTRLHKQWWGWWFETPSRTSWRHRETKVCSVVGLSCMYLSTWKPRTMQANPVQRKALLFVYLYNRQWTMQNYADSIFRRRFSFHQWLEFWTEFSWNPFTKALSYCEVIIHRFKQSKPWSMAALGRHDDSAGQCTLCIFPQRQHSLRQQNHPGYNNIMQICLYRHRWT